MKKRILGLMLVMTLTGWSAKAQMDVGELLESYGEASQHDINLLAKEYLRPYGTILGANLNAGWYTSAAPHKLLGFDISVMASYTKVPSSQRTFDVNKLDLSFFELANANHIAPTMSKELPSSQLPELKAIDDPTGTYSQFTLPNGIDEASIMITPMIQASVGLPFNSEVMVRLMPEVELDNYGSIKLWGIGLKHSLKDYIPFVKRVPFLQLSVLGAYTNFNGTLVMPDVDPYLSNGEVRIDSKAYTGRVLVGANFPMIAFYSGIGYGSANSDFNIAGNLDNGLTTIDGDIIALNYKEDGFDFNIGTRLRLGILGIFVDYSVGDYKMITAGFGFNFR